MTNLARLPIILCQFLRGVECSQNLVRREVDKAKWEGGVKRERDKDASPLRALFLFFWLATPCWDSLTKGCISAVIVNSEHVHFRDREPICRRVTSSIYCMKKRGGTRSLDLNFLSLSLPSVYSNSQIPKTATIFIEDSTFNVYKIEREMTRSRCRASADVH